MRSLDGITDSVSLGKLGVGNWQGGLVCCGSWVHKESDTTEQLNWTEHCQSPEDCPKTCWTHRLPCDILQAGGICACVLIDGAGSWLSEGHCLVLLQDTVSYNWTLHCPPEKRVQSIKQNTGTSSPTRKISQDTNPTTSMGEDSTTKKKCDLENIFFRINHTIVSLYTFLPSHYPFVVSLSFYFCFSCLKNALF